MYIRPSAAELSALFAVLVVLMCAVMCWLYSCIYVYTTTIVCRAVSPVAEGRCWIYVYTTVCRAVIHVCSLLDLCIYDHRLSALFAVSII